MMELPIYTNGKHIAQTDNSSLSPMQYKTRQHAYYRSEVLCSTVLGEGGYAVIVIGGSSFAPYHARLVRLLMQDSKVVAVSINEDDLRRRVTRIYSDQKEMALTARLLPVNGHAGKLQTFILSFLYSLIDVTVSSKRFGVRYETCIAQGVYEALIGIILKRVGIVNKVVYWAVDWFPRRPFRSGILSALDSLIFPLLDRICVQMADRCWIFTSRIEVARSDYWNKPLPRKSTVVPPILDPQRADHHDGPEVVFGYIGALTPSRGVGKSIELLSRLRARGVDAKLEIIGAGPVSYVSYLQELVTSLGLQNKVFFLGERDAQELISSWTFGLALYNLDSSDHSYYAWPLKIMIYLENALPVITTMQTSIAKDIGEWRAGIILDETGRAEREILEAIMNPEMLVIYREGVKRLVRKYSNTDVIKNELRTLRRTENAALARYVAC